MAPDLGRPIFSFLPSYLQRSRCLHFYRGGATFCFSTQRFQIIMHRTEVRFGDTLLRLNGDGSAYIPEYHSLLIADVHLGKSGVFRKAVIPAPQGLHKKNLD